MLANLRAGALYRDAAGAAGIPWSTWTDWCRDVRDGTCADEDVVELVTAARTGGGTPDDIVAAVARGVDMFDCVLPTRNGRHGFLFTRRGVLHVRSARYREDPAPPDPDCDCPACTRHSRAYLRHLLHGGEALGARLASLHNLRFYLRLLEEARDAIREGGFDAFRRSRLDEMAAGEG